MSPFLSTSSNLVFVGGQFCESHRAARMQLACSDANLRTQAIAEAVREARGAVEKHIRAVHTAHEKLRAKLASGLGVELR